MPKPLNHYNTAGKAIKYLGLEKLFRKMFRKMTNIV